MAARTRSSSRGLGAPVGSASPTRSAKASAHDSEAVGYEEERLDRRATLAMSWRPPLFVSFEHSRASRVEQGKSTKRRECRWLDGIGYRRGAGWRHGEVGMGY